MKKLTLLLLFCILTIFQTKAHVTITSSHGGQTYKPGDTVNVVWQMSVNHNSQYWDLFFSDDDGSTWDTIQKNIPITTLSHEWIVPNRPTTQGILKVVQNNPGENYEDVSEIFSISTTTGINDSFAVVKTLVYPNPFANYTTLEFDNTQHERHTLVFYDIQGQLVRTINNITTDKVIVNKKDLKSGLYFFQLSTIWEVRATGSLVIQ